jgi:hypothetical protein
MTRLSHIIAVGMVRTPITITTGMIPFMIASETLAGMIRRFHAMTSVTAATRQAQ